MIILQLVVNLARSSNRVDKPYLLLRIGKICFDSALMEYGPAVQLSVGSVQLVDRLHPGSSGQYLEMISASGGEGVEEFLTVLYRKVRSSRANLRCSRASLQIPRFKLHHVFQNLSSCYFYLLCSTSRQHASGQITRPFIANNKPDTAYFLIAVACR